MARRLDQVAYESRFLLGQFVHDMFIEDGVKEGDPALDFLQVEAPRDLPPEHIIELKRTIKTIIETQDKEEDKRLKELASQVPPDMNSTVTMNVARRLFDDGVFTWGRVLGLFRFAYIVCRKTLDFIGLLKSLIETIIDFMKERIIGWIAEQGGWGGLLEYIQRIHFRDWLIFGITLTATGSVLIYKYFSR